MCLMTKGWTCLTWLPQPEVSEIPNFFLTNVKFPWWTEQTIAQIIPENGLNPSLTVILSTHLQLNLCTMVTLGKWQGDCYIQGDHYIQVNFAENIRQLKFFPSGWVTVICRVNAIYRAVIYRFDCIYTFSKSCTVYIIYYITCWISWTIIYQYNRIRVHKMYRLKNFKR